MNDTAEFTIAAIASICRTAHKYPDLRRTLFGRARLVGLWSSPLICSRVPADNAPKDDDQSPTNSGVS